MKRYKLLNVLYFSPAFADFRQMSDDFQQGLQVALMSARSDLPNGQPLSQISGLSDLEGYGCWCYFNDETNDYKGKGLAMDSTFDLACRTLRHSYECAQMDYVNDAEDSEEENNIEECHPWNVTYSSALFCEKDILDSCCDTFNKNPDGSRNDCAYYACLTENHFVKQVIELLVLDGESMDNGLVWSAGFDASTECIPVAATVIPTTTTAGSTTVGSSVETISSGGSNSTSVPVEVRQCCGEYPARYAYKSTDGSRDCCNGHVFSTDFLVCCDDGTTAVACDLF